jgi:hypothetical protein
MKTRTKVFCSLRPCGVLIAVGTTGTSRCLGVACVALALAACGRSQLELTSTTVLPVVDAAVVDAPMDVVLEVAPDVVPDLAPELGPDLPADLPVDLPPEGAPPPPPPDAGPVCHPQPETCNGVDDDCDGKVDEGLPPIPCPNGGERYCISGKYSECPRRCEVCVPGSERECFTTFCTFWGTEACASDGRSFGPCKETHVPVACQPLTDQAQHSPELEKCCIAQGLCCLDEFDLDNDGDHTDMLGRCDSVTCGP